MSYDDFKPTNGHGIRVLIPFAKLSDEERQAIFRRSLAGKRTFREGVARRRRVGRLVLQG